MLYEARHIDMLETPVVVKNSQGKRLELIGQSAADNNEFLANITIDDIVISRFILFVDADGNGDPIFTRCLHTSYANQIRAESLHKQSQKLWEETSHLQLSRAIKKVRTAELA